MNELLIYDNKNSSISFETLYITGGYITYDVSVCSAGFLGHCHFCIHENTVQEIVLSINDMQNSLSGRLTMDDTESDAFLEVIFDNDTKMFVMGQIGGSYEDNLLKFKFKADQTLLIGLKRAILNY